MDRVSYPRSLNFRRVGDRNPGPIYNKLVFARKDLAGLSEGRGQLTIPAQTLQGQNDKPVIDY